MNSIQTPPINGYTLFCDDIRLEVNGKYTLVGVYGADLIVSASLPLILPKLGLLIHWTKPYDEHPEAVELVIYMPGDPDDSPSHRIPVSIESAEQFKKKNEYPDADTPIEERRIGMTINLVFSPIELKKEGVLKVRMLYGGNVVKL